MSHSSLCRVDISQHNVLLFKPFERNAFCVHGTWVFIRWKWTWEIIAHCSRWIELAREKEDRGPRRQLKLKPEEPHWRPITAGKVASSRQGDQGPHALMTKKEQEPGLLPSLLSTWCSVCLLFSLTTVYNASLDSKLAKALSWTGIVFMQKLINMHEMDYFSVWIVSPQNTF